jgi:thiamine-phosphate pyrophosphorylase
VSAFADLLARAIAAADLACLRIAGSDAARITTIARELMAPAQKAGVAVLLDDAELVEKLGADGVHLDDPALYGQVRRRLGADGVIGVACPLERHVAMEVSEVGADYIQFPFPGQSPEDALELIAWWAEVMTVPTVISSPPDPAIAAQIVAAGADFLAPDVSLWEQPDPTARLASLLG